jgi:hypothetical protein
VGMAILRSFDGDVGEVHFAQISRRRLNLEILAECGREGFREPMPMRRPLSHV